ncbi:MAG TPA: hypothetical protein VFM62_04180 [Arthrobacter sp.]|nr:hypothetical protein [Arthrobacter sp.]
MASRAETVRNAARAGQASGYSGHNRISTQALTSVAQAAASEVLHVPADQIRASWRDDAGLLALSLVLPIGIPSLARVARDPSVLDKIGGSIWERGLAAREIVLDKIMHLTGSQLSRVDIRITGVRVKEGGRVQ